MAIEVLLVSHIIMKSSHVKLAPWNGDIGNKFQNISSLPRPEGASIWVNDPTFRAIRMNLGWLRGHGYPNIPAMNIRIGRDEPGYMAEFHQSGRAVDPVYWSPNRVLLKGLDPDIPLVINMNPGNPWYNNDKQLFPQYRVVEPAKPFEVMPNKNGVVNLTYRYPGQQMAIIGTILLLIFSIFVIVRVK